MPEHSPSVEIIGVTNPVESTLGQTETRDCLTVRRESTVPRLDSDRPHSIDWEIGSSADHAHPRRNPGRGRPAMEAERGAVAAAAAVTACAAAVACGRCSTARSSAQSMACRSLSAAARPPGRSGRGGRRRSPSPWVPTGSCPSSREAARGRGGDELACRTCACAAFLLGIVCVIVSCPFRCT